MARLSFDFDGCIGDNYKIRLFARELVRQCHDVWIVTARFSNTNSYCPSFLQEYTKSINHADLFKVAKWCGITEDHIHFCDMAPKAEFFLAFEHLTAEGNTFLWHLDDDREELDEINATTSIIGISCLKGPNWRLKCMELIQKDNDRTAD